MYTYAFYVYLNIMKVYIEYRKVTENNNKK